MDDFIEESQYFLQHNAMLQVPSAKELRDKIYELINDKELCNRLGNNALQLMKNGQHIAHEYGRRVLQEIHE